MSERIGGVGGVWMLLARRREFAEGVVVIVQPEAELLEVVGALGPGGGLADLLHRRQQQADQDRNDRDDDEQLDQGKRRPPRREARFHRMPSNHGMMRDKIISLT